MPRARTLALAVTAGSIGLIEVEAPWSLLQEQHVRVRVQGVDLALETRSWDAGAAGDLSQADAAKRQRLEADFAERRQKLLSSEEERAHWLSLLVTAILCKAEVTITDVKVRLDDAASKQVPAPLHTYVHVYMHILIHTYMHTYMHTCMQTYMHTYMHT